MNDDCKKQQQNTFMILAAGGGGELIARSVTRPDEVWYGPGSFEKTT